MSDYAIVTTLIIFSGALLQGLAGFGGALVSMPFLLLYAEPLWAAPVVVLCYTINASRPCSSCGKTSCGILSVLIGGMGGVLWLH